MRVEVLLYENEVNTFIAKHGLQYGVIPLETVLLQYQGTVTGAPAVMLVFELEGRKVLVKTTLRIMDFAVHAMLGVVEQLDAERSQLS